MKVKTRKIYLGIIGILLIIPTFFLGVVYFNWINLLGALLFGIAGLYFFLLSIFGKVDKNGELLLWGV